MLNLQHNHNNHTTIPHMRVDPTHWGPPSCEGLLCGCCDCVVYESNPPSSYDGRHTSTACLGSCSCVFAGLESFWAKIVFRSRAAQIIVCFPIEGPSNRSWSLKCYICLRPKTIASSPSSRTGQLMPEGTRPVKSDSHISFFTTCFTL